MTSKIPIVQPTRCSCYLKLFILVKRSTCFGRSFRPSSGAQNCAYNNGICQTAAATCCYRGWDGTQPFSTKTNFTTQWIFILKEQISKLHEAFCTASCTSRNAQERTRMSDVGNYNKITKKKKKTDNVIQITANKMQRFLIHLSLQTLYMFQAVPPPIIRST